MTASTMNANIQRQFMYLFERIGEPLYFGPRGEGTSLTFYNVPMDTCPETAHASMILKQGFTNVSMNEIRVERPASTPDLSGINRACSKTTLYSYFNPNHQRAVRELRKIFLDQSDTKSLLNMACTCRDSEMINPKVWITAFASCLLIRRDTKGFRMPAIWEVMPDMFFSTFCLKQATRQGRIPQQDRGVIVVDSSFTGRDTNPENRLAYFREDLGINSHHWHWHLIYTLQDPRGRRDRKGELFYFLHHEMMARYEAERLANGLSRTKPFVIDNPFLEEGYFPKLTDTNSSQIWGSRQQDTLLTNVNRSEDTSLPEGVRVISIETLKKYRDRIMEAIDTGRVLATDGSRVPLNIDMLGDIIESSSLTPNPQFYGDWGLHNIGHTLIAFGHDPEFKFRENMGTMGDNVTAMRDPAFYRWHKYIDILFDLYKQTLQPYSPTGGELPLVWDGIQLESIQVQTQRQGQTVTPNVLNTFRMRSHVDLSRGMDFLRTQNNLGPVFVRMVHLNHDPFNYRITVRNNGNTNRTGTVRIYMAPRRNEHNEDLPMVQQRWMFFELDRFTVQLRPGSNEITRRSDESSVTIPWEQTFRELERTPAEQITGQQAVCGCGWPQHMLIPRGTPTGQLYDLVAFVTNGMEDQVQQTQPAPERRDGCRDAMSYCGILDQLYPDRKPMGYPFDRNPYTVPSPSDPNGPQVPVATLADYISRIPNMRTIQVRVVYDSGRVEIRNDGVTAGMREINGDPLMSTTPAVCPDSGQPPRTDPRPPGTGGGTTTTSSSATSSSRPIPKQGRGPIRATTTVVSRVVRPRPQSPPGSPTGWARQPSTQQPRPSSPNSRSNWGWGWQG